jgi:putative transposase
MVAQIEILRDRLPRGHLKFKAEERERLLALGAQCNHQVEGYFLIATLQTYRRWRREFTAGIEPGRVGRKRVCRSIAELVLRFALENPAWGYDRIVGEARKLGASVSAATVKNILKREGIHPTKGSGHRWQPPRNWQTFIDANMSTLLGCDFLCQRVLTLGGWVNAFVFVVIHLASRRVYLSPATLSPNHLWLTQQVRQVAMWCQDEGIQPRYLIRDNDKKFGLAFDHAVESIGCEVVRTAILAPDMNSFTESFNSSTRREVLNHFIFFTLAQLDRALLAWNSHYNNDRPHQGRDIGNRVLNKAFVPQTEGQIVCKRSLGGLLKSYSRAA